MSLAPQPSLEDWNDPIFSIASFLKCLFDKKKLFCRKKLCKCSPCFWSKIMVRWNYVWRSSLLKKKFVEETNYTHSCLFRDTLHLLTNMSYLRTYLLKEDIDSKIFKESRFLDTFGTETAFFRDIIDIIIFGKNTSTSLGHMFPERLVTFQSSTHLGSLSDVARRRNFSFSISARTSQSSSVQLVSNLSSKNIVFFAPRITISGA